MPNKSFQKQQKSDKQPNNMQSDIDIDDKDEMMQGDSANTEEATESFVSEPRFFLPPSSSSSSSEPVREAFVQIQNSPRSATLADISDFYLDSTHTSSFRLPMRRSETAHLRSLALPLLPEL